MVPNPCPTPLSSKRSRVWRWLVPSAELGSARVGGRSWAGLHALGAEQRCPVSRPLGSARGGLSSTRMNVAIAGLDRYDLECLINHSMSERGSRGCGSVLDSYQTGRQPVGRPSILRSKLNLVVDPVPHSIFLFLPPEIDCRFGA